MVLIPRTIPKHLPSARHKQKGPTSVSTRQLLNQPTTKPHPDDPPPRQTHRVRPPTALTTTTTSAPPEEVCGGELCVEDNYYFERFGNDYWAFRFRVDKSCSGFYVEVHLLDDNGRRTGDWGKRLRGFGD